MDGVALVFAVILGLPCGVGIALYISAKMLDNSNNFGDSKGNLFAFSNRGIEGKIYKDRIKKNTPLDPVMNPVIIEHDNQKNESNHISEVTTDPLEDEIIQMATDNLQWHK